MLNFNGTEIKEAHFNGVPLTQIFFNGVSVFELVQGYYLNLNALNKDHITINESWGTVSGFNVEFNIERFNDTLATTYVLLRHGNDFRADPSFRLAIVSNRAQVFIRNTGGTIETVQSVLFSLPFSGVIKIENNSLWVGNDEYPITYNMDTTWNDEVQTYIGINNNLTAGFTGGISSFKTPLDSYLLNEGSGFPVFGVLGGVGTGTTSNTDQLNYWNSNVWKPAP